jgi:flagellar protein FliO/FliZ
MPIGSIVLALLSLAVVLVLVLLAGRAARAGGWAPHLAATGGNRLSLVQTIALDPRRRLHLVHCDGRHVLLLTGGGSDVVAGWPDMPHPGTPKDAA